MWRNHLYFPQAAVFGELTGTYIHTLSVYFIYSTLITKNIINLSVNNSSVKLVLTEFSHLKGVCYICDKICFYKLEHSFEKCVSFCKGSDVFC